MAENKIPDDPDVAKLMGKTVMTMGMPTEDTEPTQFGLSDEALDVDQRPTQVEQPIDMERVNEKRKVLKVQDPNPEDYPSSDEIFARPAVPPTPVEVRDVPVERKDSSGRVLKGKGKLRIENF